MPINKSELESKWYYRAAKVLFIVLPFIIIILWLLSLLGGSVVSCGFVPAFSLEDFQMTAPIIVVGTLVYFAFLILVWRSLIYVIFGGIKDDTEEKAKGGAGARSTAGGAEEIGRRNLQTAIPLIILAAAIIALVALSLSKPGFFNNGGSSVTGGGYGSCPATSKQMSTPCHSVRNGVGVSGVIVPARCLCPGDTTFEQMDNITAGGPYRICSCN